MYVRYCALPVALSSADTPKDTLPDNIIWVRFDRYSRFPTLIHTYIHRKKRFIIVSIMYIMYVCMYVPWLLSSRTLPPG